MIAPLRSCQRTNVTIGDPALYRLCVAVLLRAARDAMEPVWTGSPSESRGAVTFLLFDPLAEEMAGFVGRDIEACRERILGRWIT